MNNHSRGPPPGADQSALSLLVNAADSHDPPRPQRENAMNGAAPSLADTLRLRGLTSGGFEEQLLFQQQQQQQHSQSLANQHGLLSQLRDQNLLSQLNQHQLASLLGLGGVSSAPSFGGDMRSALAAAQLRQQAPQLSQADLIALSRSGGLSSLSSLLGGGSGVFSSDLDGQLQRLEELERQQRLLSASSGTQFGGGGGAVTRMPRETIEASQIQSMSPQLRHLMPEDPPQQQHHHQQQPQQQQPPAMAQPEAAQLGRTPHEGDASPSGVPEHIPKDEVEKAPGSVIVPCRARGMPMDHNFKTAYFVIPENVKHGEELICSYFACRNAGIKFRYCSHCKVPVAKRNFRKRHKHGGEIVAGEDSGAEDDNSAVGGPVAPPSLANKRGIPSQIMASREEPEEADALSSQTSNSVNHEPKDKTAEDDAIKAAAIQARLGLVRSSMRTFQADRLNKPRTGMAAPADGGKISQERKERWEALLTKRPSTKEGDSMSNWLMEVLSVSDLETPLKGTGEERVAAADPAPDALEVSESRDVVVEEDEGGAAGDVGSGVVVKKKRPAELLGGAGDRPGSFAGGSFAEWKERKKQRKLAKSLEPTQEEEV